MSQFGPNPFQVTSNAGKPKIGTLYLTYTLNSDGTITGASFTYQQNPGLPPLQTYNVDFSGSTAPYSGSLNPTTMSPPLNVPGEGNYKSGTLNFTPPTTSPVTAGSLTGTFSTAPGITTTDDNITWEADASTVPEPEAHKTATPGKY
jgi:hypothetical protein